MIDVTIRAIGTVAGLGLLLQKFFGPPDRRATVVHTELAVDVPRVGPQGAQWHYQLAGDVRSIQVGPEQPKHVKLASAQGLYQDLCDRRSVLRLPKRWQE